MNDVKNKRENKLLPVVNKQEWKRHNDNNQPK